MGQYVPLEQVLVEMPITTRPPCTRLRQWKRPVLFILAAVKLESLSLQFWDTQIRVHSVVVLAQVVPSHVSAVFEFPNSIFVQAFDFGNQSRRNDPYWPTCDPKRFFENLLKNENWETSKNRKKWPKSNDRTGRGYLKFYNPKPIFEINRLIALFLSIFRQSKWKIQNFSPAAG